MKKWATLARRFAPIYTEKAQEEEMFRAFRCASLRTLAAAGLALLAWACTTPPPPLPVQPRAEIDLAELTQDTRRQIQKDAHTAMVWWLPEQYWNEALRQQKSPEAMVVAMREAVRPYLIVFALDVALKEGEKLEGKSEEALRASIRLRDAEGRVYPPIPWADVSPAVAVLLGNMQPQLASMMGQLGASFRPFVFPAQDAEGRAIADPLAPGRFSVEVGETTLVWELPLAALVAPRICPVDSAEWRGTYRFCPVHGVPLVNR